MSNRIAPVDPGALGKMSKKPGKAGASDAAGTVTRASAGNLGADAGDKVELTGRGRAVAEAAALLQGISPIDQARVDEVRLAIQNGEYVIDADTIADALLRSDLEIGQ